MKQRLQQTVFIPWRFYLILSFIFLLVLGLLTRMLDLTILKQNFLKHQSEERVERVLSTPAFRGMILDRNHFPLAVSASVFSVWMNPKEYSADKQKEKLLTDSLEMKPSDFKKVLLQSEARHKQFTYLKRDVSPEAVSAIKALKIPGIYFQEGSKRFYPEGEVTGHLIGFTDIDDKGQEGLELAYNESLRGVVGKTLVIKDRHGRAVSNVEALQQETLGHDLVLSIDKRIQYIAYRELMTAIQENKASSGTAVVLDTKTGEVLAMVNQPAFNPNNRIGVKPDAFRNRALTDSFEPGSTIKAFSIASALDSGLYKPTSMIDTHGGWMRVERHIVRDEHAHDILSVAQVLQYSSNVGVSKMILSLPPQQLWNVLHRMGFGQETGLHYPGEQNGSLVKRAKWHPFSLATLSFGYGLSVTPMQLAAAYSVFANHGIKKPISLLKVSKAPEGERVMDQGIADQMLSLLESVTNTKGATGWRARVPGYRIAGKTGTSNMAGRHGYQSNHTIATFIGIAPVSDPRLVVAVIVQNPQSKIRLASHVAAPAFEHIMEASLRTLDVPPDDEASLETAVTKANPVEVQKVLEQKTE